MNPRRATRPVAALAGTLALLGGLLTATAAPASAAPIAVDDATFRWAVNPASGMAEHAFGCRFMSAGTSANTGSAVEWETIAYSVDPAVQAQFATYYRTQDGNARIVKPNASGADTTPTFGTRCQDRFGAPVTSISRNSSENEVVIENGTGTIDVAANTATIEWDGSFTVVHYGGTAGYWTAADPTLTVDADGTGTVTATLSGFASDRENSAIWKAISPRRVTVAELTGVTVTADGLLTTPTYRGRTITVTDDSSYAQQKTGPDWGAFPQPFVDFVEDMGLASFFYSSGSGDAAKVTSRILVGIGDTPLTGPISTGLSLAVSPTGRVVAGNPVTLTATVSPAALGSVAFRDGSKPLGTVPVSGGKAKLTTTALVPNPHSLRATFVPADESAVAGSTASPRLLTVVKAGSKVTLKTKKKVKQRKKPVANVRVRLIGTPLVAGGKVTVKIGKAKRTATLNAKGRAKVRLPKQKKAGKRKVTATYAGSAVSTRSSAKKTITVTKRKK